MSGPGDPNLQCIRRTPSPYLCIHLLIYAVEDIYLYIYLTLSLSLDIYIYKYYVYYVYF